MVVNNAGNLNQNIIERQENIQVKVGQNKQQLEGNQIMQADPQEQKVKENVKEISQSSKAQKKQSKNLAKQQNSLEEQVVFSLILSIHEFTSNSKTSPNESTNIKELNEITNVKEQAKELNQIKDDREHVYLREQKFGSQLKVLQRNGIKRSLINEIIYGHIKPIPYNTMNDVRMKLRSSLHKIYLKNNKITTLNQTLNPHDQTSSPLDQTSTKPQSSLSCPSLNAKQLFDQSIRAYTLLSGLLRQASIPTPVQEGFYQEYNMIWKLMLDSHQELNTEDQALTVSEDQTLTVSRYKDKLLQIWKQIPHQSLNTHLSSFDLTRQYSQLPQPTLISQLSSLLVDNKIQQSCTYYETYFLAKYPTQTIPSKHISIFEDQVLIPKITKSQHIFSSHVLSLFKSNPLLKQRLLNSLHLDPAVGVRIVDLLKQDGRKYPHIQNYCLKQHYKSIVYDHKQWWIVEDKLSFNRNFIQWYTQDFIKVSNGQMETQIIQNDRLQKIAHQIKDVDNLIDLELSLLKRNQIIDPEHPKLKDSEFKEIPNPLYQKDRFDCSQLIIQEIVPDQIQDPNSQYLKFQQHGVSQQDINIIDQIGQSFNQMCSYLLQYSGKPIGFDTEFRCVSTKYQQQGVSLIQLSTSTKHYIIDFLKLQNSLQFKNFIVQLLCNPKYIKVGHTISSDIKYLTYTLSLPQTMFIQSFVDISQIFKTLNPNEKFSSLSFLCMKFLNCKLSKYEQRSNWNRRPLRKAQIHYAALDAFACVLIYQKIHPEYQELLKHGKLYKAKLAAQSIDKKQSTETVPSQVVQKQQIEEKETTEETQFRIQELGEQVKVQKNFVGDTHRSENLVYHKKFQIILSTQSPKFLVDNMLKKLSAIMRNCGLDAEYIAVRDYQLASAIAQKQGRIILTRDTKFFQRKDNKLPIYLIKEKTDSQRMFQEITHFFKIDLSLFTTLSRCVKCNGPELIIINTEQAMKEIKFKYQDSTVKQFWRCTKCKQIYWEGGQFERAKQKYANIKKQ